MDEGLCHCGGQHSISTPSVEYFRDFARYVKPSESVLDLGCGKGRMRNYVKCREYVGVDVCPEMIAILAKQGVNAVKADFRKLPFKDKSFDWGGEISALYYNNKTWRAILQEWTRVCKNLYLDVPSYWREWLTRRFSGVDHKRVEERLKKLGLDYKMHPICLRYPFWPSSYVFIIRT